MLSLLSSPATATTWDNSDNNNQWFDANDWNTNVLPTFERSGHPPDAGCRQRNDHDERRRGLRSLTVNDNYTLSSAAGTLQVGTGSGTINVASTRTLMLSTPLHADANALTFNGNGVFTLNVASSRTGITTISSGMVRLSQRGGAGEWGGSHHHQGASRHRRRRQHRACRSALNRGSIRVNRRVGGRGRGRSPSRRRSTVLLYGGTVSGNTLRIGNATPNTYTGGASSTTVVNGPGHRADRELQQLRGNLGDQHRDIALLQRRGEWGAIRPVVIDTGTLYLDNVTFNHDVTLHSGGTIASNMRRTVVRHGHDRTTTPPSPGQCMAPGVETVGLRPTRSRAGAARRDRRHQRRPGGDPATQPEQQLHRQAGRSESMRRCRSARTSALGATGNSVAIASGNAPDH